MFHLFDTIKGGKIYTIAEMSANHAGRLENAIEIVHKAAQTGASCLKIQTYTADTLTIDCHNDYFKMHGGLWDGQYLYDLYKNAYTPWDWQKTIKKECERVGLDFLSTPFDKSAVDFLESIGCEAYKIASFELVDIPLIEYAASKKKPMIISCGMGSVDEISDAVDACRRMGNEQIVLLKCCSEYPTDPNNMNLSMIQDMKVKFGVEVGLSDHSMGCLADIVAVAYGATVIEKHFCLSRKIKNPDSDFSMEPVEFAQMVESVQTANKMRGSINYGPTQAEMEEYKCRRSLFAVKDIKKGELLTKDNVKSIRPNNGISPKFYNMIIGKKAVRDISFGTPLKFEDIERVDK